MKLFWFIFILTILLHFYRLLQFAGFSWDQEQLLAYPVKAIIQGKLTLIGPQTGPGGIFLGPWIYYLAIPFFWIFRLHPIAGSVLASTLGVTTALGLYLLFKKFFTQSLALIGFTLYAASPLFNLNDRTIWNPSLIPPASLGVLAAYLGWWKYGRATYSNLSLLATSTALGIQAHLGFLFILPLHLLAWLILKPTLNFRKLVWFLLILIFWFSPLILFDLRHQGINVANFLNFFLADTQTRWDLSQLIFKFLHLFQSQLQLIGAMLIYSHFSRFNLLAGGLIFILLFLWRRQLDSRLLKILLAYLFIFAFGFSFYRGNVPDYYLWPVLLPSVLITVLLIDSLIHHFRINQIVLLITLIFFLSFSALDELSISPPDSLHHKLQAVQYIINRSQSQPFRVLYDTDVGRNYGFAYLFDYYGVKPSDNLSDPAFVITVPEFFRTGRRSDIAFGSIGIINPKDNSQ